MTEQTNAELIAEERRDAIDHIEGAVEFQDAINPEAVRVLVQAARALEAADQRAAEYAAVVEKVRAYCDKGLAVKLAESTTEQAQDAGLASVILREALDTAPADALRDHDAALIEGLAERADEESPYDAGEWLRRQREGQS